ncbi:MAG: prepilin-type N-terminal cleavage/methylation domain-containing protein [Verrucomicrobia bacterium]|nr:prepilin-type N-terminal cleavage/methylation domain-containing protein [Verrucomicrobiota bacterium]
MLTWRLLHPLRSGRGRLACLPGRPRRWQAFTLTELLVAVTLMSLIIFALYSMFDQTQKALRSNVTQVDVLESARAALELLTRDVEQATYSAVPGTTNLYALSYFNDKPTYQQLNDRTPRTNYFQELFFLTRSNNYAWMAHGYFVASLTNPAARVGELGVGTLYRFAAPLRRTIDPVNWTTNRLDTNSLRDTLRLFHKVKTDTTYGPTNIYTYPLLSGVTHARWLPFDKNGRLMTYRDRDFDLYRGVWLQEEAVVPRETKFAFTNPNPDKVSQDFLAHATNPLPAYLELELATLEADVVEQLKSMGSPQLARNFFTNQVGRVHLFRQRLPIRTVPR